VSEHSPRPPSVAEAPARQSADRPAPARGAHPLEREVRSLIAATRASVRGLFHAHGIGPDDAEDIVQEALIVVVQRWEEIDDPPGFFLGTLKHRIQTHFRRRRNDRCVSMDEASLERVGGGESPQRQVECRKDAQKLLSLLPERSGQILEMRYVDELSPREIALAIDGSESGVRKSTSRGLGRLRQYVKAAKNRV
jgi:RNA polymerase sigma factor (sigma-70 family)